MVRLLARLKEVHRGAQARVPRRGVGRVMEDMAIIITDADLLPRHHHLHQGDIHLIRPLHHSNHHLDLPMGMGGVEMGTHLLRRRLNHNNSSRDSILADTSTQIILRRLLIRGRALVGLHKEVLRLPRLMVHLGLRLRAVGCNQDQLMAMVEVKPLHMVVVVVLV